LTLIWPALRSSVIVVRGAFVAVLALCNAGIVRSQVCTPDHIEQPKEYTVAAANIALNLLRAPNSLRAKSVKLLEEAKNSLSKAKPTRIECANGCRASGSPSIILVAVPNRFLTSYSDFKKCEDHLAETSLQPLRFGPHQADSTEELSDWLSEVSQGNGKDGALLYRECDGICSPRYSMEVVQQAGGLIATLTIVCGHARDKNDNTYTVSSRYRWTCEPRQ